MNRVVLIFPLAAALTLLSTGCPEQGVVCTEGLTACGTTCEDLSSDRAHCGACGNACAQGEVCQNGSCACSPGATACGEGCVVLTSNPQHCGACGNGCGQDELCDQGTCRLDCTAGATVCGASCVNLQTDPDHCGGCGNACQNAQSCHAGVCSWDLVAACITNGQLVGFESGTYLKGPARQVGSGPQSLAQLGPDRLLSLDGFDSRLYPVDVTRLEVIDGSVPTGSVSNHVLVEDGLAWVVNSGTSTLQIVGRDGGALTTVGEHSFGANAFPQVVAKVGSRAFITLWGGLGPTERTAGQKVVELDVSDPAAPAFVREYDLEALPLEAFTDGGQTVPRPQGITHRSGTLYVALNNLDPVTHSAAGPGYLATIPLDGGAMGVVELPADTCLNPGWVETMGTQVVASCAGLTDFSQWPEVTTTETGLVLVDAADAVQSSVEIGCPAASDAGCAPPSLGRFGIRGARIFVGDQAAGRIYVFRVVDGVLTGERTHTTPDGPLLACPVNPTTGYSNVADILSIP